MKRRRIILALVLVLSFSTAAVACTDRPACAEVVAKAGGSGGGGKSSGGGGASKSPSGKPSSGSPSGKSGGAGQSRTAAQAKAAGAVKPGTKPSGDIAAQAKASAPASVSRGGSYTSPVTGTVYVSHSIGYYRSPGYIVDYMDPMNPYNYWYWTASPYYGRTYMYANACGAQPRQVSEQSSNINITVDNSGKVVQAEDKNPQDADLVKADENDTVPTTALDPTDTVAP